MVRDVEAERSTLTDDAGRFHLDLPVGVRHLQIRRIGYSPAFITITVPIEGAVVAVALRPLALHLPAVVVSPDDAEARRIIAATIARKQRLRGAVHDDRYDANVRKLRCTGRKTDWSNCERSVRRSSCVSRSPRHAKIVNALNAAA